MLGLGLDMCGCGCGWVYMYHGDVRITELNLEWFFLPRMKGSG